MSMADSDRTRRDPIGNYLAQLRGSLRGASSEAELILAEAEDHLRETAAVGVAIGMTEREAQEAAISAFGPVRAVVRAHRTRRAVVVAGLGDAGMTVWKLASLLLLAGGVSGLATVAVSSVRERAWASAQGGVHVFAVNPDSRWLAWSVAVAAGAALLAGYGLARRRQRHRGRLRQTPLSGRFPAVAAGFFAAVTMTLLGLNVGHLGVPFDPGLVIATCLALAVGYAVRTGWVLRQARGQVGSFGRVQGQG
jgi:hypothetical protein